MHPLVFIFALSTAPAPVPTGNAALTPHSIVGCTAQRLKKFIGPFGVDQQWPTVASLPAQYAGQFGQLLSDQGAVADGYMQTLHVDAKAQAAYLVQTGGFAGTQTIYGPLPVGICTVDAP